MGRPLASRGRLPVLAALAAFLAAGARAGDAGSSPAAREGAPSAAPFAEVARAAREFRYAEAERVISGFLDAPPEGLPRLDRARFGAYAAAVLLEADLFRLAAGRVRSGEKEAVLGRGGSDLKQAIRLVDERGLTVTPGAGGEAEALVPWEHVPDQAAYSLVVVCCNRTSLAERLGAAVFAHNRGLDDARDEELRVAARLARTPRERDLVDWVRGVLAAVREETAPPPRRADAQAPG